jgi:uncharacterized damage-inducible protein DinB
MARRDWLEGITFDYNLTMASQFSVYKATIACLTLAGLPAFAQADVKAVVLKHLKTSRDFTLKVAAQMPEADYGFKLTPPQMSFAQQMTHLSEEQAGFLAPFTNAQGSPAKPASMNKKDVIAFVGQSFDRSIETVSKLTPDQISKTYNSGEGTMTGLELLMFLMDHTTHHRASAEMYLRAKGITPTDYQF